MMASVNLPQSFARDMRVDLRRRDVGMAEHGLDRTQVSAVFQQVRGKRMPQGMRRDVAVDPRLPGAALDNLPETLACQPFPERLRNTKADDIVRSRRGRADTR